MKFYAGIGSRTTPPDILEEMTRISKALDSKGYILRSGGAKGADTAFELGSTNKEIFKSQDAAEWSYTEVKKHLPIDRKNFDSWSPYVKGLMARNMMQILGVNGDQPVEFVICWTPSTFYEDSSSGGTGYAIRCALSYNIPIYNLSIEKDLERLTNDRL